MSMRVRNYALIQAGDWRVARTGRPAEGKSAKLAPLNMRTSPELRAKIEEAAELNGRSLTQEVERRLITSFIFDEVRGGPHIGAFANMLAATIQTLENRLGAKWIDDVAAHGAVRAATVRLIDWNRPSFGAINAELYEDAARTSKAYDSARNERDARRAEFGWCPSEDYVQGLLDAGTEQATDPRAGWTEAQKIDEAALDRAVERARADAEQAQKRYSAAMEPFFTKLGEAEDIGRSVAEATFADLGPRNL